MSRMNTLKLVHFASTGWFVLSGGFMLVFSLVQSGKSWWIIVSLSGYSTLIAFLLVSFYLFAVFRGVSRSQKTQTEHPLTTSICYLIFYDISPFLGSLAGILAASGSSKAADYLLVSAVGSLWTTFLVWIIVDPVIGLSEMLVRSSREHRRERLTRAKAMREKQRLSNEQLLAEIRAKEKEELDRWSKILRDDAGRLAAMVAGCESAGNCNETEAIDIGLHAWQMGGVGCMRQLHRMTTEIHKTQSGNEQIIDYISIWWDGIGDWRSHWLSSEGKRSSRKKGVLCVL